MSGSVEDAPTGFEVFDVMGQFTDTVAGDVRDPYPALWAKRADTPVEPRLSVATAVNTWEPGVELVQVKVYESEVDSPIRFVP